MKIHIKKIAIWLNSEGTLNIQWIKPYFKRRWFSLLKLLLALSLLVAGYFFIPLLYSWLSTAFIDMYVDTSGKKSEVFRNIGLVIAALISLPFLIWRSSVASKQAVTASKQAETAVKSHISDTFTQAISQLGSVENNDPNIEVRLGGIYSLEKIAINNQDYYSPIIEILCSYVRKNSPCFDEDNQVPRVITSPKIDIQTILTVLSRINNGTVTLSLQKTNLAEVNLVDANLTRADLTGANLVGANLARAILSEAKLEHADLSGARLFCANLTRADLSEANLFKAYLVRANLTEAYLIDANLTRANLRGANIFRTNLTGVNLTQTNLTAVNIGEQQLTSARKWYLSFGISSEFKELAAQARGTSEQDKD